MFRNWPIKLNTAIFGVNTVPNVSTMSVFLVCTFVRVFNSGCECLCVCLCVCVCVYMRAC